MQAGDGNVHYWLTKFVREICAKEGIELSVLSHGWLMELQKNEQTKRIVGFVFDFNSAVASSIGRDKVAAYELMKAHAIPAVPHFIARLNSKSRAIPEVNWSEGIVVKPLNGQGGRDVRLFYDSQKALKFMESTRELAWAVSPLENILREIRVFMLDGKVLHSYAKQPVIIHGLRVYNLEKGAEPIDHLLTKEQEMLAQQAQRTLGLRLAAVDLAELESGELKVLEVNSAITMERYAAYSAENAVHAKAVYAKIIRAMF